MTCNGGGKNEINTPTCAVNTTTVLPVVSPCATRNCSCGCSPCQCQGAVTAQPTPYYNSAKSVQECHVSQVIQQTFITSVSTGKAFNMPSCGVSVTILLPGVQKLQVGGYLWNATYGYLYIVSFDVVTSKVVVTNECQLSNAAPGTLIPACTQFNVVDPPYESPGGCEGDGVYVTADFVVPDVGALTNVSVTTLEGIVVNGSVQISTGVFTVVAIVDGHTITIENNGLGGLPGSTISAKDINGNCVAPITPFSENPCDNNPVSTGSLVVCSNGSPTTLDATILGQVPVCVNTTTNAVEFQTLNLPTSLCSALSACVTIVGVGVGTTVSVIVNSTVGFLVGDLVVINYSGIETVRWVITNIDPDGVTMTISAIDNIVVNVTVPDLTEVCTASCCDQVAHDVAVGRYICDYDWSSAQKTAAISGAVQEDTTVVLGATFVGQTASVSIVNDTCNPMSVMANITYFFMGSVIVAVSDTMHYSFTPYFAYATTPLPGVPAPAEAAIVILSKQEYFGHAPDGNCVAWGANIDGSFHYSKAISVPAQSTITVAAHFTIIYGHYVVGKTAACCGCANSPVIGPPFDTHPLLLTVADTQVDLMGVAVQA